MRLSSSSINPQVKAAGRDNSRRLAYVCLMWTTFDGQVKQYNNQSTRRARADVTRIHALKVRRQ